jgi:putative tryptophan/tyrosine transport system substrate-binding protein
MRRREFIAGLGTGLAWPLAARAQFDRVRRIGVLIGLPADDTETKARLVAFRQGMQQHGWSEGRNLQVDYRWAGPEVKRIEAHAKELVGTLPDVIVAITSPSVAALQQATRTIPIVFAGIGDPVGQGFVASLARPGGNVTGFTGIEFSLGGKWVDLLKQIAPSVTRAAYLFHPEMGPYYPRWLKSVEGAAAALGMEVIAAPVRAVADIERVVKAFAGATDGLIVQPDGFTVANRGIIIEVSARYRLPAVYTYPYEAVDGGLVSYGPVISDQFRRSAAYVDRLLKGAKPEDLPVQQPLKYELVVNLKTAKALGLTIPETLLATADEVIQ